ncbi:hypothetical protein [Stetteria hydrogenophila]
MKHKLLSALTFILIAIISFVAFTVNVQRLRLEGGSVSCEGFTLNLPPGEYVLNYAVYGLDGVDNITVRLILDSSSCSYVRGVTFIDGQRMGLPWLSPTRLGPYALPSLNDTVLVNIVPLFYTSQALAIYYPVNATKVASGVLETPYGVLPVDVYECSLEYQFGETRRYDYAKLYYDKATGLLVGASYVARIEGLGEVASYSFKLSGLSVKPLHADFIVRDPPTTLALIASSGMLGGVSAYLAVAELARRED